MPSFSRGISAAGFRYTLVDYEGFRGATAPLQEGGFAPIHGPVSGLAAFVAHPDMHRWSGVQETSPIAWYRQVGPGDLPGSHGGDWSGARETCAGVLKSRYQSQSARDAAKQHALGWWSFQRERLRRASKHTSTPAHGTLVLDASALTQSWWEGPHFLEHVLRISTEDKSVHLVGLDARLEHAPRNQVAWPGPVLATESSTEILPYALPRIAACAQRISALLNTDLSEEDAEGQSRLLLSLNAYVSAQDALAEDSRRAMERIRLVSDWVTEQSSKTQSDVGALSAFAIDVFVADDLQHLVLT